MRTIVKERQRREINPTIGVLQQLLADPAMRQEPAAVKLRLEQTLDLLETLTVWSEEMLKLDTETLTQVLKLGARIKKLLGEVGPAGRRRRHDRGGPARPLSRTRFHSWPKSSKGEPWPPTIR